MYNYNRFHKKNERIQKKLINRKNYVYQTLIELSEKYFIEQNSEVIDLGCGVGTFDFFLAAQGYNVIGVDISDKAIDTAKKSKLSIKIKNIEFQCSDLLNYKFNDKYRYVVCSEVIEHLDNDEKFLVNVYKNIKHKGILILSTPLKLAPLNRLGMLKSFDTKVGHLRRYDEKELTDILKKIGFEIVEVKKVEGILRNVLFTNDSFGFLVRFIRWPISIAINVFDDLLRIIFGSSNIYYVLKKS